MIISGAPKRPRLSMPPGRWRAPPPGPNTTGRRSSCEMIKIIAVLCRLASPADCHEQIVTTSDFADVTMQSCLMGAPQLAEWMVQHPGERLAAWRCSIGSRVDG